MISASPIAIERTFCVGTSMAALLLLPITSDTMANIANKMGIKMNAIFNSMAKSTGIVIDTPIKGIAAMMTSMPFVVKSGGVGVPTTEGCSCMMPSLSGVNKLSALSQDSGPGGSNTQPKSSVEGLCTVAPLQKLSSSTPPASKRTLASLGGASLRIFLMFSLMVVSAF